MKLTLWKGYHEAGLFEGIAEAWDREELLVLCPPLLQDFSFLRALPAGELILRGMWSEVERAKALSIPRAGSPFNFAAVVGVFTSGTLSSSPRLVLYSRRNLSVSLRGIYSLFDASRITHLFCYPQAFHTFGLTLGYLAAHIFGWRLHTPTGKYHSSAHANRLALREENTLTLGTPAHFFDLLRFLESSGEKLAPSYASIMGGAGVQRSLWLACRDRLGIEAPSIGYGCTEASPGISHLNPGVEPTQDDEIGRPLEALLSRPGADGVAIEGPALCEAIVQNGEIEFPRRLVIRDKISVRADGSWVFAGRLDLTMNRGGQKFSLEAIEKYLGERLNVSVVASPVRDSRLGEDLGLAMVRQDNRPPAEILSQAQVLLLSEFSLKIAPARILFLEDFPLNESSKLDRRATRLLLEDLN